MILYLKIGKKFEMTEPLETEYGVLPVEIKYSKINDKYCGCFPFLPEMVFFNIDKTQIKISLMYYLEIYLNMTLKEYKKILYG